MKKGYVKDTDILIVGTLESLQGKAEIEGFDEAGEPVYGGHTEIYWDEQRTIERDGKAVFLDEDGTEYTLDEIEFREEATA